MHDIALLHDMYALAVVSYVTLGPGGLYPGMHMATIRAAGIPVDTGPHSRSGELCWQKMHLGVALAPWMPLH